MNEVACYAMKIITTLKVATMVLNNDDRLAKDIKCLNGFVGINMTPEGDIILLFRSLDTRKEAFEELTKKKYKCDYILPVAYVDEIYLMTN